MLYYFNQHFIPVKELWSEFISVEPSFLFGWKLFLLFEDVRSYQPHVEASFLQMIILLSRWLCVVSAYWVAD